MINHKHQCIFVHVIKTAGVSICKALDMSATHCHLSAQKVRLKVGEDAWGNYFKFSIVRNPFDKIVSQYHYNRGKFGFKDSTFKEYIKAWNAGQKISTNPQLNLFYIDEKLDFVGRFETLQQDFNFVCDKIGIPQQQLPHKNKSQHKHYTEYYDDETREIVEKKYAKDIEYFGYKFGE